MNNTWDLASLIYLYFYLWHIKQNGIVIWLLSLITFTNDLNLQLVISIRRLHSWPTENRFWWRKTKQLSNVQCSKNNDEVYIQTIIFVMFSYFEYKSSHPFSIPEEFKYLLSVMFADILVISNEIIGFA